MHDSPPMSTQIVGRACAVCEQRIRAAVGTDACEVCEVAFHVACASRGLCPRCGEDVAVTRARHEQAQRRASAAEQSGGSVRFWIAMLVGGTALVPIWATGVIAILVALGIASALATFRLAVRTGLRGPTEVRVRHTLRAVAIGGSWAGVACSAALAWAAAERLEIAALWGALAVILGVNGWFLMVDRLIGAYVAFADYTPRPD